MARCNWCLECTCSLDWINCYFWEERSFIVESTTTFDQFKSNYFIMQLLLFSGCYHLNPRQMLESASTIASPHLSIHLCSWLLKAWNYGVHEVEQLAESQNVTYVKMQANILLILFAIVQLMSASKISASAEEIEAQLELKINEMENYQKNGNYVDAETCRITVEQLKKDF